MRERRNASLRQKGSPVASVIRLCLLFDVSVCYPPVAQTRSAQTMGLMAETCLHLITQASPASQMPQGTSSVCILVFFMDRRAAVRRRFKTEILLFHSTFLYIDKPHTVREMPTNSAPRGADTASASSSGVRLLITSIQTDRSHTEVENTREYCVI